MIYSDNNDSIIGVHAIVNNSDVSITAMYIGARLFWQSIRSCYGRGYWISDKPWIDNDIWKNDK